jgi:ADP-heptose:LPS heptosyltransferase
MIIYPVKSPELSQLEIIHDLKVRSTLGIAGCNLNAPQEGFPMELQQTNLISDCLDVSSEDPWRHELLTTLDFLCFMGSTVASIDEIQPQFWLSDSDKNLLTDVKKGSGQIIGLFPGGSILEKCWEPWNYREFAKMMGGTPTYVIFGSLTDKELALQVELSLRAAGSRAKILNLIGKTTLRELAKSVSFCDLFISMDTSGLHMAINAGVPTIGIVGGVHYQRFVPWGDPEKNKFLTKKMDCFHCRFSCYKQSFECVQGVTPDEVAHAAKRLLKDRPNHEQTPL